LAQKVTVTATSAADPTKTASASVSLAPPVSVSLSPGSVTLRPSQSQMFTASVSGTSNTAVAWSLSPALGSISAAGLYTAPSSIASAQTVTVTATSAAEPTKTASAIVSLTPPVSVSLSPGSVTLTPSQTQVFAASVSGTSNTVVAWSLSPALGSISAAGLYTAPSSVASAQTVSVTAISAADPTKTASTSLSLVPPVAVAGNATITWNNVDQVIDGFGASNAFLTALTPAQADLFFSTTNGVGLSLLRTQVPNDGSCATVNSTCAGQISDMQLASARGARVWSTPWSPPATMTTSGSTNCTASASPSNLAPNSYAAYAKYLSNYISSVTAGGVPLYALSIQNEPNFCASYGGAIWSDQNLHDFVKNNLGPALTAAGQNAVKVMLPEAGNWSNFTGLADTTMADPAASAFVGILAFHGYDNSSSISNPYVASGKSFWQTEVSGDGPSVNPTLTLCGGCWDPSIGDALLWAQVIHYNLTGANVNAWNYWWLQVPGGTDNEGLVRAGVVSKRLYMMGNYSKFVRPGWYRIDVTASPVAGVFLSAYKNPSTGDFAIVAINTNSTNTPITLSMNGFSAASVTPWVTSASLNLVQQPSLTVLGAAFMPTLAAQSVTTFVGKQL
jgi:O-glycosyl hydrolase